MANIVEKKIKTFTVDEETYGTLAVMFKEYEPETSLSYYVDKCLKDLLCYLIALDKLRKNDSKKYTVPMSYAIDTVAREHKMSILKVESGEGCVSGQDELEEIQVRYEAEQKKIPVRFWRFLRTGKFHLSSDNRYLISNETGQAYKPIESGMLKEAPDYNEHTGN